MAVAKHPIIYPDELILDGGVLVPTHVTGGLSKNRQFSLNTQTGNLEYRVNGETRVVGQGVGTGGGLDYGGALTGTGNATEANKLYGINSQGVAGNALMPENPEVGDRIAFVDLRSNLATRNFTIRQAGSAEPIQNEADSVVMGFDNQTIDFFYTGDADAGWLIVGGSHLTGGNNGGGSGNTGYTVKAALTGSNNATDANSFYPLNATGGAITAKFPESPEPGNVVHFSDSRGSLTSTNSFTLQSADSGEPFLGGTDEIFFNERHMSISWIYVSVADGWMVLSGTHLAGSGGNVNLGGSGGGALAMRNSLSGTDNATVADSIYPIDAATGSVSAKFPESPAQGDRIHFVDLTASISETNTFTLLAADSNEPFMQSTEALEMTATRLTQTWMYTGDAAAGWIIMGGSHLGGIIGGGGTGGGGTEPGNAPLTGTGNVLREGVWERIDARTGEVRGRMPESPEIGDIVEFIDMYGSFGDNAFILLPALTGERIAGQNDSLTFVTPRQSVRFRYSGPEQGWVVVNAIIGGSPASPFSGGLPFNILSPSITGDVSGAPGGTVTLTATGAESAFTGEGIAYEWLLPSGVTQVGGTVSYSIPADNALIGSTVTFVVTARGDKGNTSAALVHDIRVLASQPPNMDAFVHTFPVAKISADVFNLTMSGATDPDGDDNLIRYELSELTNFTASKTAGIAAGEVVTITANTVAADRLMTMRIKARDEDNVVSSAVDVQGNLYAMGFVNKPVPTLPTASSTGISVKPSFNAGTFTTTPGTGAARTGVEVRVATDSGMGTIVAQQTEMSDTAVITLTNGIPPSTQVWYQMRYISDNYGTSEWSDPIAFTTGVASAIADAFGVFRWMGSTADVTVTTDMDHAAQRWAMLTWTTSTAGDRINMMVSSEHPSSYNTHYSIAPGNGMVNELGIFANVADGELTLAAQSSICKDGQAYLGAVFMSKLNVIDVVRYQGDNNASIDVQTALNKPVLAALVFNISNGDGWYWNATQALRAINLQTGAIETDLAVSSVVNGRFTAHNAANQNGVNYIVITIPEGSSTDATAPLTNGGYTGSNNASGPLLPAAFKPSAAIIAGNNSAGPVNFFFGDQSDTQTMFHQGGQFTPQQVGTGNVVFSSAGMKINTPNASINNAINNIYTLLG